MITDRSVQVEIPDLLTSFNQLLYDIQYCIVWMYGCTILYCMCDSMYVWLYVWLYGWLYVWLYVWLYQGCVYVCYFNRSQKHVSNTILK